MTTGTLHVDGVSVDLGGHRIVDDVTLGAEGNIVGLVGPNGSGKSTLLRTIYRAIRPAEGRVRTNGRDVWTTPAREAARVTAAVVQDGPVDLDLTVEDFVRTGRLPHGRLLLADQSADREIIERSLRQAGVLPLASRHVSTLSGGERQRVHLARALAQEPQVLILDEPTNHLDIRHQLHLLDLIRDLEVTTLVTLHELNLAAAYCDEVAMLREGRIVAFGTPEDVFTPQNLNDVFGVLATAVRNPLTGHLQLMYASGSTHDDPAPADPPLEGTNDER